MAGRSVAPTRVPPSFWARAAWAVLVRPRLWATALRQGMRLARPQWWRQAPWLPLPDADYLSFRFETQYGGAAAGAGGTSPAPRDLVEYLEWCRELHANGLGG
jgi:hypothetical protein